MDKIMDLVKWLKKALMPQFFGVALLVIGLIGLLPGNAGSWFPVRLIWINKLHTDLSPEFVGIGLAGASAQKVTVMDEFCCSKP